jgi:transcriptional regulator with XRE-family HTH domain
MEVSELETIISKVCHGAGSTSHLAEMLGTTPATVSRWRKGLLPIKERDEKLLRLIYNWKGQDWSEVVSQPVQAGVYEIL